MIDRRGRDLARAHQQLAALSDDVTVARTIAQMASMPLGGGKGAFFAMEDGKYAARGIDSDGRSIVRAVPGPLEQHDRILGKSRTALAPFAYTPKGWWMSARIRYESRAVGGVIVSGVKTEPDSYAQVALDGLLAHAAAVLALRAALGEQERLASTDALTGAASRRAFLSALERAAASRAHGFLVYYIDLDGFKAVNDRLGHEAGDQLLVAVTRELRKAVRASDVVGRLGGDEFAVLAEGSAEDGDGLMARLGESIRVAGAAASIGWRVVQGDATEVLRSADALMYSNKMANKAKKRLALLEKAGS